MKIFSRLPNCLERSDCMRSYVIPPASPYSLIQESLWPDGWKILVACMLLNCTTRKSVEKVLPRLFEKYPDASSMAAASPEELSEMIASLGFRNRRSKSLISMSKSYLQSSWRHARELPGIGEYAAAAWEIFTQRTVPNECPKDHALTLWWKWYQAHYAER